MTKWLVFSLWIGTSILQVQYAYRSAGIRMDIGIRGMVKSLREEGSNARSQCAMDNFFIWLLFVIISCLWQVRFWHLHQKRVWWVARGSQSLISYPVLNNADGMVPSGLIAQIYAEEHYSPTRMSQEGGAEFRRTSPKIQEDNMICADVI